MACSCWETPYSATVTLNTAEKALKNALALNNEIHTLHQLQSFSLLTLRNTKCKHHEDLGNQQFLKREICHTHFPHRTVPAMGRKRHAIGAPGDDTVSSLKRYCFPGKDMCLIRDMEHGTWKNQEVSMMSMIVNMVFRDFS